MKYLYFLLFTFIFIPSLAKADSAPDTFTRAGLLFTGDQTNVQMVSEKVVFENFRQKFVSDYYMGATTTAADVTAEFWMKNLGKETEDMQVFFPFNFDDFFASAVGVQDVKVLVNDKEVENHLDSADVSPEYASGQVYVDRAYFNVTFKPGITTKITVKYVTFGERHGYKGRVDNYNHFGYILESGAGWKNSIGSGQVIIRLPYKAEEKNVSMKTVYFDSDHELQQGQAISPVYLRNELIYSFKNLEPTKENNLSIDVYDSNGWKEYILAKSIIASNSGSAEAHLRLGKVFLVYTDLAPTSTAYRTEFLDYLSIKYGGKKPIGYYQEAFNLFSNVGEDWMSGEIYVDVDEERIIGNDLIDNKSLQNDSEAKKIIDEIGFKIFWQAIQNGVDFKDAAANDFFEKNIKLSPEVRSLCKQIEDFVYSAAYSSYGENEYGLDEKLGRNWFSLLSAGKYDDLEKAIVAEQQRREQLNREKVAKEKTDKAVEDAKQQAGQATSQKKPAEKAEVNLERKNFIETNKIPLAAGGAAIIIIAAGGLAYLKFRKRK